jgi:hypothetical protein
LSTIQVDEVHFLLFPKKSTYFMNDAALAAHQTYWQRSLAEYPVLRIVGREPTALYELSSDMERGTSNSAYPPLRIVSVGRLVAFKSYNMHAAKIIRQLLDAGIDATWDIWGYGPDEAAILSTIEKYDVSSYLRLRGSLPHYSFDETVSSYDVFVGMGTAVLEAAKTGMPAIVGVENESDSCYGHLNEAPTDSVGDRVENFPERRLYDVLSTFAALEAHERTRTGQLDAAAAQQRESTLDDFVAAILAAEPINGSGFSRRILLLIARMYLSVGYWKNGRVKR